jgi:hypothetical protein
MLSFLSVSVPHPGGQALYFNISSPEMLKDKT